MYFLSSLVRFGVPSATKRDRERTAMIADGFVAQTEAFAVGLVEGRFQSLETAVFVLTRFAVAVLGLEEDAAPKR